MKKLSKEHLETFNGGGGGTLCFGAGLFAASGGFFVSYTLMPIPLQNSALIAFSAVLGACWNS